MSLMLLASVGEQVEELVRVYSTSLDINDISLLPVVMNLEAVRQVALVKICL